MYLTISFPTLYHHTPLHLVFHPILSVRSGRVRIPGMYGTVIFVRFITLRCNVNKLHLLPHYSCKEHGTSGHYKNLVHSRIQTLTRQGNQFTSPFNSCLYNLQINLNMCIRYQIKYVSVVLHFSHITYQCC